mgnify:CR=1 FL=1
MDKHYEINVDLDEFTRLFDVLDLMANSATTVINAVDTYSDVKKRINDYKTLLNDYNEKLLLRGNIMPGDTIIISVVRFPRYTRSRYRFEYYLSVRIFEL